jgi:hypothetical protein
MPSSFKVLGDNTNLSKAWEQYFKRYYLKAIRVTKDEQKRALLLHVAGEAVQDISIFNSACVTESSYVLAIFRTLSNVRFSTASNFRRSSVELQSSTT